MDLQHDFVMAHKCLLWHITVQKLLMQWTNIVNRLIECHLCTDTVVQSNLQAPICCFLLTYSVCFGCCSGVFLCYYWKPKCSETEDEPLYKWFCFSGIHVEHTRVLDILNKNVINEKYLVYFLNRLMVAVLSTRPSLM